MSRTKTATTSDLLIHLRARGGSSAMELAANLKISRPTVSRLLGDLQASIIVNESIKPPKYFAKREFRSVGDSIPVFVVSEKGACESIGMLRPVHPRGYFYQPNSKAPSVHYGIPYFIIDNAPQGFLGKNFSRRYPELNLPNRTIDWSEDDIMEAICRRGENSVGNIIVGRESFTRFQNELLNPRPSFSKSSLEMLYSKAASEVLLSDWPGSSAAGEQPKFTISFENGNNFENLLVKFSPSTEEFRGRRWADLLIAESIALHTLDQHKYSAAKAQIHEIEGKIFLELKRFDRVGKNGRIGVISLASIQDEMLGNRANWVKASTELESLKFISADDSSQMRLLHSFGGLIANSDRHPGNISFFNSLESKDLCLTPTYDMLPMLYAPGENNQAEKEFHVEAPSPDSINEWNKAMPMAIEFWNQVSIDKRISIEFRKIAKTNEKKLIMASKQFS